MAEVKIDYNSALDQIAKYYGQTSDQWFNIHTGNARPGTDEFNSIMNQAGVSVEYGKNSGNVVGYYKNVDIDVSGSTTPTVPNNSNTIPATTDYGSTEMSIPMNTTVEEGDFTEIKQSPMTNPKNTNEKFTKVTPNITGIASGILNAYVAGAVGISMGKTITNILYQVNPDIYNGIDPNTINYKDYYGNVAGGIFNAILGTDTTTGKTQAYLDINDFAAIALQLYNKGMFTYSKKTDFNSNIYKDNTDFVKKFLEINKSVYFSDFSKFITSEYWGFSGATSTGIGYFYIVKHSESDYRIHFGVANKIPVTAGDSSFPSSSTSENYPTLKEYSNLTTSTLGDYYYYDRYTSCNPNDSKFNADVLPIYDLTEYYACHSGIGISAIIANYAETKTTSLEGTGTQTGATIPDLSGVDQNSDTAIADAIQKIYDLLPSLKDNAVTQTVVQPDGSTKEITYVPIAVPDNIENPTSSDNSTQANPTVDPSKMTDPSTDPLLKTILALLLKQKDTPTDTGNGDTPVVIPPTGTANALFAIYNPTEAQIKSFGAWLWSPNFIDQLLKMFNNPSEAIIGLHKVFVTPITGAEQNIKVGYLDSGVASKIVTNQYVTIDCGTITLAEFFGNVFDYSPFTDVSLYLPFIGIVKLNNADVLRSTINIVYHADVINGSVLAEVKVNRDGAGGTLYQYTGNCAVEYPLSSGSYIGMITGALSLGAGIAGTIASGGNMIPAMMGATAGLSRMHSDVSRSGSFSGNAGAMGIKKPYLIISRPQTELADKFTTFVGKPSNYTTTIGACKGFTKVDTVHIENVDATSSELDELNQILTNGILV